MKSAMLAARAKVLLARHHRRRRRPVIRGSFLVAASSATGLVVAAWAGVTEYRANAQQAAFEEEQRHGTDRNKKTQDDLNIVQLPRTYDWDSVHTYWQHRPIAVARRLVEIAYRLVPVMALGCYHSYFNASKEVGEEEDARRTSPQAQAQKQFGSELRRALESLGPAFVKAGQQLSIRPDLVPAPVLLELQALCDHVAPVPDAVALEALREELGVASLLDVFDTTPVLVASASLGQVYKGTLTKTRETVAVKVQRPGMLPQFSLDLYLLQRLAVWVDAATALVTEQPPFHQALYESFCRGSYSELDYELEAQHQLYFKRKLRALLPDNAVHVPEVHLEHSRRTVLTTEWVDGIKLAECDASTVRRLIPVGVQLFLTQLLEVGAFHADPHAGNLLVVDKNAASKNGDTKQQQLCLLDFGLVVHVSETERQSMTRAIVHLLKQDWDALVQTDAKELGFLPHDMDTSELQPLLVQILTVGLLEAGSSDLRQRSRKLGEISSELNEVFFRYPFSVPPFFALVTRGLGLLEGIALTGDPEFNIFAAAAPYARRRAVQLLMGNSDGGGGT